MPIPQKSNLNGIVGAQRLGQHFVDSFIHCSISIRVSIPLDVLSDPIRDELLHLWKALAWLHASAAHQSEENQ
jgi:hypothetical protein